MIDETRWENAIDNAKQMLELYRAIPTGIFGVAAISNCIERYNNGERTTELLEELENIQ